MNTRDKMNKQTKEIYNENKILEEKLSKKGSDVYIDMIVHMKRKDLSEYNCERIKREFLDMIIEKESRGYNIEDAVGYNYKEICDKIISEYPSIRKKDKIMNILGRLLDCIFILSVMYSIQSLFHDFLINKVIMGESAVDWIQVVTLFIIVRTILRAVRQNEFRFAFVGSNILSLFISCLIALFMLIIMLAVSGAIEYIAVKINVIITTIFAILALGASIKIKSKYNY
jgi:hypothetical protein